MQSDTESATPVALLTSVTARLVGDPTPATLAAVAAVLSALAVARQVAAYDAYVRIEHALPTYAGTVGEIAVVAAAVLLCAATLVALLGAGLLPTFLLAAGPVFGWAIHYGTAPVPPYAATFPVEMAVLYGGVLAAVGYGLGAGLRTLLGAGGSLPR